MGPVGDQRSTASVTGSPARDLLVVAGEASGDLHGARLLSRLRELEPGIRAFGLGGEELRAAGMELVADSSEISVVGIAEALKILPKARRIFHRLLDEVDRRSARAAVLIDFPDFNLRLAGALKQRGLQVIYFISPQVWAWRQGRVRTIARRVDRMLVVLPFEVEFYRRFGVEAIHVGHPLIDEVPELDHVWDQPRPENEPFEIALLPGSRASEIEAHLPCMLAAAGRLASRHPVRARLIKARAVAPGFLEERLAAAPLEIEVVATDRFAALSRSHLAICASGTATLEVGLLGTPMIVVYRVRPWSYLLGRWLVHLPYISLVNLVLGKQAVPELIQDQANPSRIADEASGLLGDHDRIRAMRRDLGGLRGRLGEGGASRRAAAHVVEALSASPTRAPS